MAKRKSPWLVFFCAYGVAVFMLVLLHCFPDARVVRQSQSQYWGHVDIKANRGVIQDCRGNSLVISKPVPSFAVDPKLLKEGDAWTLQQIFSGDIKERLDKAAADGLRFVWIRRRGTEEEAERLRALNMEALRIEETQVRHYPNQKLLAHVLGFCDIDNIGQSGIEQAWDSVLYTPPSQKTIVRSKTQAGAKTALQVTSGTKPANANSTGTSVITLTIDSRIQYVIEKHLFKAAEDNAAKWAAGVCIDPWTGAILAMASWPTFDPGDRTTLNNEARFNNVISRGYEPGSTFKPIALGIALERGWARTDEIFHCPGKLQVSDGWVTEAGGAVMGDIDTAQLLVKSSNVGMAQIGIRADKNKMYESLSAMGFGQETDIELLGVSRGILPYPEQWRGVVPANIAFGQGLSVTPLQLITAMASVVNGGDLLSPWIVKQVVDSNGEVIYQGEPQLILEAFTPETTEWLRQAMRRVITEGTGKRAATDITKLAGKTGTAQVPEGGKYSANRYVASFIGFWPFEHPQYLMLIVIGEPSTGRYYGGEIATPPAKAIIEEIAELDYYAPDA